MAVEDLRWWTGTDWVSVKDFNSDSLPPGTAEGQLLQWDGYGWSPASEGTTSGQLLSWDDIDKRWVPSTALDDYLPLAGGTMTGTISWNTGALINDAYGLANTFSVSTNNSERFRIDNDAITAKRQFLLQNSVDRNAPALAFGSYKKTGLYLTGVDDFAFANNGVQTFRMYANGQVVFGNGNATPGTSLTVNGPLAVANVSGTAMILRPTLSCSSATTVAGFYSQPTVKGTYDDWVGIVSGAPTGTGVRSGFYRSFQAETSGDMSTSYYAQNHNTVDSWAFYQAGSAPSLIPNLQTNLGSAAAPAISFNGMTSTGLFSPSTDSIAISTGGTERFRIRPNGAIGLAQSASVPTTGSTNTGITQRFDLNNNGMLFNSTGYATNACNTAYGLWFQINSNADPGTAHSGTFICVMIGTTAVQAGTTINEWRGVSIGNQSVPDKAYAYHTTMAPRAGKERYAVYCEGSAPSRFDGQLMLPAGDQNSPSITLTGESTGLAFTSNTILFVTGGVERFRVTPQGHITAADAYYPVADQDLATLKYVNDQILFNGGQISTNNVTLANPTRSLGRFSPPTGLATQEDANQAIGDAIAERKIVLPISRAEYDALADKDPDTLYLITS